MPIGKFGIDHFIALARNSDLAAETYARLSYQLTRRISAASQVSRGPPPMPLGDHKQDRTCQYGEKVNLGGSKAENQAISLEGEGDVDIMTC